MQTGKLVARSKDVVAITHAASTALQIADAVTFDAQFSEVEWTSIKTAHQLNLGKVIGVLVATGDGKHAGAQDILDAAGRRGRQRYRFLAADGWKTERIDRNYRGGECGPPPLCGQDGFDTQSLSAINALPDSRQRSQACGILTD